MSTVPNWLLGHGVEARRLWALSAAPAWKFALLFCVFQVAFFFAYRYAMAFSFVTASPFWFPVSILLCALLVSSPRWWIAIALSTLPIRLFASVADGLPAWFLMATFTVDSSATLLAAAVLRRSLTNPLRFATVKEYAIYVSVAVLLVPAIAAVGGAAARQLYAADYAVGWWEWFRGNALAHLVVTPAILYWVLAAPWKNVRALRARRVEQVALLLGIVVSGYFAFYSDIGGPTFAEPRLYLPIAFLLWAAIRFGMLGASGAVSLIAFMSVHAALTGRGPFAGLSPADTAIALQHFLFERAAPLFLIAILIEQSQRVENSLRESEQRFRRLADTAPVMIWQAGTDRSYDFVNQVWLDFTGRTLREELGNGWVDGVHAEDLPRCLDMYRQAFDLRQPFDVEFRLRHRDCSYRWIHCTGVPRYSQPREFLGYVGCAIDVTEARKQVAALRASEERYREVVNTQTDLVCRFLPDTTITFVNEAYARYFGRTREQLIGTSFLELLPESAHMSARDYMITITANPERRAIEHEVRRPDGTRGWQHWVDHPIFGVDGQIEEFQAIGYDITDRKRAEEANRNLAHASRLAAMGELTALVAHEVNQPLCAIRFNAEAALILLQRHDVALGEIREILTDIYKDNQRADDVIRGIRHLSCKRELKLQPLDVNDVVEEVLHLVTPDALRREVEVVRALDVALPPVDGDLVHLQQVVLNLVVNAMDALREVSPPRRVSLSTRRRSDGFVEVAVADNGPGVPADRLPRIFDSFFSTKAEGIGIGLSVARSIVQTHGGRIWAQNNDSGGATFAFVVPTLSADDTGDAR